MHDVWSVLAMCCLPAAQTFHKHPFGLLQPAVCTAFLATSAAGAFRTVCGRWGCTIQVYFAGLIKRLKADKTASQPAWNSGILCEVLWLNDNTRNGYSNAPRNIAVMQTSSILNANCPNRCLSLPGIGVFGALQLMARALHNVFINVTWNWVK